MAQQRVEFFDDRDDAALLAAARGGDSHSADVLWIRVRPAAVSVARRITRNEHDAEDLASEALSKVFAAIGHGHGPSESLLSYVCQTMRNLHISTIRRETRAGSQVGLDDEHDLDLVTVEPDALESEIVTNAFKNLPQRWRHVLWASLVEGRDGGEIAAQLGIKPAAVHALKARALEGLRQQYLTEHAKPGLPGECAEVHRELAAVARGKVRRSTDVSAVWRHLRSCEHCAEGYREISAMNNRIGALLGPAAAASVLGSLPHHAALGPLTALRASTTLTKLGVAAGFTGVIAASATAVGLRLPQAPSVDVTPASATSARIHEQAGPPRPTPGHHLATTVRKGAPGSTATAPTPSGSCLPTTDGVVRDLSPVTDHELLPGVVAGLVPTAVPTSVDGHLAPACAVPGTPNALVPRTALHRSGSPLAALVESAPSLVPPVPSLPIPSAPPLPSLPIVTPAVPSLADALGR
jgi:RNA polymerase sigma factor (sigma-70 family)